MGTTNWPVLIHHETTAIAKDIYLQLGLGTNCTSNPEPIMIGAEAPILWPPDEKSRPIRKDPDAGKDWRQEEKGMTEDEMVGWHHLLNKHEFEQALGNSDRQGRLASLSFTIFPDCLCPRGHKGSETTLRVNSNRKGDEFCCLMKPIWSKPLATRDYC